MTLCSVCSVGRTGPCPSRSCGFGAAAFSCDLLLSLLKFCSQGIRLAWSRPALLGSLLIPFWCRVRSEGIVADFWSITRNLCQLLVKVFDRQIVHGEVGVVVCRRARRSQEQRQNPLL